MKLYCVGGKGIAIQSTFKRFKESFDICENIEVNIGMVNYIDYSSDMMSTQNLFTPYLHARAEERQHKCGKKLFTRNEYGSVRG